MAPFSLALAAAALACWAVSVPGCATARERVAAERGLGPVPRSTRPGAPTLAGRAIAPGLCTVPGLCLVTAAGLASADGASLTRTALLGAPALCLLSAACWTDLRVHRLPNPLLGAAAVAFVTDAVLGGTWWALLIGAAAGLLMLLLALTGTGMGMGDVKLEAVLATWLGTQGVTAALQGLLLGMALGGVTALWLLLTGRAGRGSTIALGPPLLAGAVIAWGVGLAA